MTAKNSEREGGLRLVHECHSYMHATDGRSMTQGRETRTIERATDRQTPSMSSPRSLSDVHSDSIEYTEGFGDPSMYLISGMHRSGTSLIARFFFEAGADFGDSSTFHPADRWNPDGYFEQPEIHAINMPLINGPWGKLTYFRLPSSEVIMKRARLLSDQITRTAETYRDKVIKENRFCLTLPAWRKYGANVDGMTICLRHPTEIASSLKRRNRIPYGITYRLWQTHLERLLDHTRDIPTRFVRYENVLDDQRAIEELRGPLHDAGTAIEDDQIRRLHGSLVRLDSGSRIPRSDKLPRAVARFWDELLQRHASQC